MYWKQLPLLLLFSLAGTAAHADNTVYDVNLAFGGATATGTITTDGTLGTLVTDNIKGFSLTLSGGGNTATLFNNNAVVIGDQFSATAAGLFYNFDNSSTTNVAGFASDLTTDGSSSVLCFTGGDNCPGSLMQAAVIRLDRVVYNTSETGTVEIASIPVVSSATPEPSSLALLGAGLVGIYGAARRRFA